MQHEPANYEAYAVDHRVGTSVQGRVRAVAAFGVFIELAPNVQGLLEVPYFSARPERFPEDYPAVGTVVQATILWFDVHGMNIRLTQQSGSAA
jgi:small subunit ribosomal protein S1